jgi:microcystin-dependent protein
VGWALCNGQLLSIAENDALFSLLGTTYGGDGASTFGVPDLRGRSPVHVGTGGGLSTYVLGQLSGAESVTLQPGQLPAHTHNLMATSQPGATNDPTNAVLGSATIWSALAPDTNMLPTANVGGSQAHENRQPSIVVNYCIATQGIYPSQA